MPAMSYQQPGLVLRKGPGSATRQQIRDLQRDLRALGYLRSGIDGGFGDGTELAVRALQRDLLVNDGTSAGEDGTAPVKVRDYNRGRISAVTGEVDQPLVECISEMLKDPQFPTLPSVEDPTAKNSEIVSQIAALPSQDVPVPFLMAILQQESGLKHFHEPGQGDTDTYITIGLDANDRVYPDRITSRGYGAGQYTLFHHPARPQEVTDVMLDVEKNLQKAIAELRGKFDGFVNGPDASTRADDRLAEFGKGPLRLCKYLPNDPRYLRDCKQCALQAGVQNIEAGVTELYAGSGAAYEPTPYYREASYGGVPIRKNFGCDWPYAARRYNGSGINSYHYQVRILKNLQG